MIKQVFEALPVEAATLASSVQPLQQNLHRPTVELLNPVRISFNSIVVVIPTEFPVQLREEEVETKVAILLAPLGEVGDRVAELLSGGPSHDVRLPVRSLSQRNSNPRKSNLEEPGLLLRLK